MNLLNNAIDALENYYPQTTSDSNATSASAKNHPYRRIIKISTEVVDCPKSNTSSEEPAQNLKNVVIHIADNGPGIPKKLKKRIFDPFFTTKSVGEGTGLGLSISYQIIVEKHGGQLQCLSEPGKGTEFIVEIPLKTPKFKMTRPQVSMGKVTPIEFTAARSYEL